MKQKKWNRILLSVCLFASCIALAGCTRKQKPVPESAQTEVQSQAIDNTIEWKGKKYKYNHNLNNILFLGVDKSDPIGETYLPGETGQSDCIMLLSLDTEKKKGRILQINRNTYTQVDVYDENGNYANSIDGQLALQYAYDIGGSSSCWAVKKTVGELLYGVPVDGYFALDLDGIAEINDALGGVDVLMKQDYTMIDPSFAEGQTVHLEGMAAQHFVRYRDQAVFNSVQNRMERQTDYVTSLIDSMNRSGGRKLYDVLSPYLDTYVITDLDADQMNALAKYTYDTDEVAYLPGEMREGKEFEEFYVDADALQDLLISMFYVEAE